MEPLNRTQLLNLLRRLVSGQPLEQDDWRSLEQMILADTRRARAFGVSPETVAAVVQQQAAVLVRVYPDVRSFCQSRFGSDSWLDTLWTLWLPLALWLVQQRQRLTRPLIQGILGGQGTGKTTLGAILSRILNQLGYQLLSLSLDDLYKTHAERLQLRDRDPRLIWRGPPGTHDVELGIRVLDALRQPHQIIEIPRFDKSLHQGAGDRITPDLVSTVDIVLFEGWFVGVRPIDPAQFETAPAPIVTEVDRAFARDMNAQLQSYLPLWQRLDSLLVLYPVDYRLSKQWRKQAEQEMSAHGNPGMTDAEIDTFVDYFWKALHPELFIQPLVCSAADVDLVVEIRADHTPGAVYSAGDG